MTALGLREQVAEPANLWIRYVFSRWPVADRVLRSDLATGGLPEARFAGSETPPDSAEASELVRGATDVVYLPPVPVGDVAAKKLVRGVTEAAVEAGTPLLIQLAPPVDFAVRDLLGPGAAASFVRSVEAPPNAVVVIDLLAGLVRSGSALGEQLPPDEPLLPLGPLPLDGATAVWPLVAGWTDDRVLLEAALPRLAAAGVVRVVPRPMALDPSARRLLAGALQPSWPEAFDALFHVGDAPPATRPFFAVADALHLESRLPRPLPAPPLPLRLRHARELAGRLIERGDAAGDEGASWYRAARFLDRGEVDIHAIAREGNLRVLPWLEEPARTAVEQWLTELSSEA